MITSKKDYKYYLLCDKIALGETGKKPRPFRDKIWHFECLMRKLEYYTNCSKSIFSKIYRPWLRYRYSSMSLHMGFSIPINTFREGLSIAHYGTIVVSGNTRIGKNCRIHECTTIGATNGSEKAPQLGDNVFIGTGARIIGDITIGNDIAIAANAVVTKSFLDDGITIGGIPAKQISNNDSHSNLNSMLKENEMI